MGSTRAAFARRYRVVIVVPNEIAAWTTTRDREADQAGIGQRPRERPSSYRWIVLSITTIGIVMATTKGFRWNNVDGLAGQAGGARV
jgi:hypothetical protein